MGRLSLGRSPGDGLPRPSSRRSDHPEAQRQVVPRRKGEGCGNSFLLKTSPATSRAAAPVAAHSVTTVLALFYLPEWPLFPVPPSLKSTTILSDPSDRGEERLSYLTPHTILFGFHRRTTSSLLS